MNSFIETLTALRDKTNVELASLAGNEPGRIGVECLRSYLILCAALLNNLAALPVDEAIEER